MKSFIPFSLGSLGTFNVSSSADNYWQERVAHEMSYVLYQMSSNDITFSQEESSDMAALTSDAADFASALGTWLSGAVSAQSSGSSVPAIPTIPSLPMGFSPQAIAVWIGEMVLRFALNWLFQKFNGNSDTGELADKLEKIFMIDDDGDKKSVFEKGLLSENGSGGFYSNLWLLASQPIEIYINRSGNIEAVTFNSN